MLQRYICAFADLFMNIKKYQQSPMNNQVFWEVMDLSAVILANFGSSGNFISESMEGKIPNWKQLPVPIQVRVANGNILTCTHELPACKVWVSGQCFNISLKILPLRCYDVILGMD